MISLHKLQFHVHYEEVYYYKRFQKFSIKTLTRIARPNSKTNKKISLSTLGIKAKHAGLALTHTASKGCWLTSRKASQVRYKPHRFISFHKPYYVYKFLQGLFIFASVFYYFVGLSHVHCPAATTKHLIKEIQDCFPAHIIIHAQILAQWFFFGPIKM